MIAWSAKRSPKQHPISNRDSNSTFHIPHSKILEWELECGFPHSTFHIPMHFSRGWEVRHSEEGNSISKLQNSGIGIGINYLSSSECLTSHHAKICIGMWNMECGMWKSTFGDSNSHFRILECGMCNVDFHIPYSTFQCILAFFI